MFITKGDVFVFETNKYSHIRIWNKTVKHWIYFTLLHLHPPNRYLSLLPYLSPESLVSPNITPTWGTWTGSRDRRFWGRPGVSRSSVTSSLPSRTILPVRSCLLWPAAPLRPPLPLQKNSNWDKRSWLCFLQRTTDCFISAPRALLEQHAWRIYAVSYVDKASSQTGYCASLPHKSASCHTWNLCAQQSLWRPLVVGFASWNSAPVGE